MHYIGFLIAGVVLVFTFSAQAYLAGKYDFECQECHAHFHVPPTKVMLSPHRFGKKLMTCPVCGARTWAVRVPIQQR